MSIPCVRGHTPSSKPKGPILPRLSYINATDVMREEALYRNVIPLPALRGMSVLIGLRYMFTRRVPCRTDGPCV